MTKPQAQTLVEVLTGLKDTKDKGITFIVDSNKEEFLSYHQLYASALSWLKYLQDNGLQAGDELVLQVKDNKTFVQLFWACILGAVIPVPVAMSHHGENAPKVFTIAKILNKPVLITDRKYYQNIIAPRDIDEAGNRPCFDKVLLLEEGENTTGAGNPQPVSGETIAFLQFSSGSTGHPKGVVLRHSNLLDNTYGFLSAMACNEQDSHLSWMPLTHDMGLIGFHLYPLVAGVQHYLMPTDLFVRNPLLWMQKASAHKITVTASPNFGYKYYLDHFTADKAKGLDLSAVRIIFNGAEPISASLCQRFMDTLASYNLSPGAMYPVYGLAEATLDVTIWRGHSPFQHVYIRRKALNIGDSVTVNDIRSGGNERDSIAIVNTGTPISGMAIEIVNEQGERLPEGYMGIIRIKGKSVTSGYYNNDAATVLAIKEDGWLDTGDTGFIREGCLYVAGRKKDIIIVNGANVYPHDIEQLAETLDGVEAGRVVACGIPDEETASEAIVIFVLYKAAVADFAPLATTLKRFIAARSGLPVKHVIPVRKIFKTTSGKVKRYLFAEEYLKGVYDEIIRTVEQADRQKILTADGEAAIKAKSIRQWLEQWLRQRLRLSENDLVTEKTFVEYGMTSMQAVELSADMEAFLQITVDNTVVYNFPTPSALINHFSGIGGDVAADYKAESRERPDATDNCIAVIGIGCRFPGGAYSPEAFWKLLQEQGNAVAPIPEDRWNVNAYFDVNEDAPGKIYTRQGGFIEQPGHFDPLFFGISPKEAACMDPQQRLLLEVCWEALEHAGYAPQHLRGSESGVFIGLGTDDYQQIIRSSTDETYFEDAFSSLGIERSVAAGRIAYLLDFRGPVLQLDTACSSSLLSVHLACKSLLQEECTLALAGGVNLMLTPETTVRLCRMKALSPSDCCSAFDDRADGYVRGEGGGMVVLKRLSDALADGDNVLAVIKGSAVNHDGESNGLTAPNGIAQQRLIEKALQRAGIDADTVQYVEAHGTGTRLGDPVEVKALQAAYGRFRAAGQPLLIGTVKTNIGHLEAAAGIAGFIKTVLSLQHKQIPASLHFREPNRFIPWDEISVKVASSLLPWEPAAGKRRAGVSAFGLSGTNVHIILEEAAGIINQQPARQAEPSWPSYPVLLSAQTPEALRALTSSYIDMLDNTSAPLPDIAYSTAIARNSFQYRLGFEADSAETARQYLKDHINGTGPKRISQRKVPAGQAAVVWLFTGQGSQYWNMGRELYEQVPVFKKVIDYCDAFLSSHWDTSLVNLLYSGNREQGSALLRQTQYAQPALFALEYALAEVWKSWGIFPSMVAGHSVGEYVAACVAGVFSLDDGLTLIMERARLMQAVKEPGGMAIVFAAEQPVNETIRPYGKDLSVAAVNGPEFMVISGGKVALESALQRLKQAGISCRELPVSHAFHSSLMEPVLNGFRKVADSIRYHPPLIPLVSNVTGEAITDEITTASYWCKHLLSPVRFSQSIKAVESSGDPVIYMELGPQASLLSMVQLTSTADDSCLLPSLRQNRPDWSTMLQSLVGLYVKGIPVSWDQFYAGQGCRKVRLPNYPFQRKRYWIARQQEKAPAVREQADITAPAVKDPAAIQDYLTHILGSALNIAPEDIDIQADLLLLGADSLVLSRLVRNIEKEYRLKLPVRQLFSKLTTIKEVTAYISAHAFVETTAGPVQGSRPLRIPLSFAQERLWFIDQLEGSVKYHESAAYRLKGALHTAALVSALQTIVNRHEVLRTVIDQEGGQAYQRILERDQWQLITIDGAAYRYDQAGLQDYLAGLIQTPFDLSEHHMLRAWLISLSDDEHILLLVMHHIAVDAWSAHIIYQELIAGYSACIEGRDGEWPSLKIQYADYAIWQREYLTGSVLAEQLDYWKDKLSGVTPLQLPTDFTRPLVQSARGAICRFRFNRELSAQLQAMAGREGVTLFMLLLAAFKVLLYRYSGQEDICIGSPVAGRNKEEEEALIGFFVNILALRSNVSNNPSFTSLLQQVKETTLSAYEHQHVPFEKVVGAVTNERDMSRNVLFSVAFTLLNTPAVPAISLGTLRSSKEEIVHTRSLYDLNFLFEEVTDELGGYVEYSTDLYTGETVHRMMEHYEQLLRAIVKDPSQTVGVLNMLAPAEEEQLLSSFNNNKAAFPEDKTLITLIEEQMQRIPEAAALIYSGGTLSYGELDERSNRLGHYLRHLGVREGALVPVCLLPGASMIVGILGILKAGGAYVPIDANYPAARIRYILEDTGADILVSEVGNLMDVPIDNRIQVVDLTESAEALLKYPSGPVDRSLQPSDLAYVIYTSGSTGHPKGVMIEHRSVVNYLVNRKTAYLEAGGMSAGSFVHLSYTFDASITALFLPLLSGRSLVIGNGAGADIFNDAIFISHAPYDFIKLTPAHLPLLEAAMETSGTTFTGRLVLGGEALHYSQLQYLHDKGLDIEIINEYGPTEATVGCTTYSLRTGAPLPNGGVPIGKPIDNVAIYVLDAYHHPVPIGVTGDIYIGGAGVGRGYLNLEAQTAAGFIPDGFSGVPGARLYRTGDLGRWLPDGTLLYTGRKDDQVKIRGYRIEPEEIAFALNELEMVAANCMVVKEDESGNKLVCYYVPDHKAVLAKEQALTLRQVANWQELYETEYAKTTTDTPAEFNLIGWNDSFTGEAIPEEQMREWLDDITAVLLSDKADKVFEIGCGTGLLYYQLAGSVKHYIGADLSEVSLNQIRRRLSEAAREYPPTILKRQAAHEITLNGDEEIDLIVINSVVQYFPGEQYLSEVIKKSISALKGGGRIVIGDVRDNRLLRSFKRRLSLDKLSGKSDVRSFEWEVDQELLKEEELCISPGYFYKLQSLYPEITHIDIQWKQGNYVNELTLYRYSVTIYVGVEKETLHPDWLSWNEIEDKRQITEQFDSGAAVIALRNAPNPRLWKEFLLERGIKEKSVLTVVDLLEYVSTPDHDTVVMNELLAAAAFNGYHCRFLLSEDPFRINLLLERQTFTGFIAPVYDHQVAENETTNTPLFGEACELLKQDIQRGLRQRLPDYMMPADFIGVKYLPLTNNGKIDKKFLSACAYIQVGSASHYEAPSAAVELQLADIWKSLLGVDRVGLRDDFFELGGHSLLAIRVISAIRKDLQAELTVGDIFLYPTIAGLAAHIQKQGKGLLVPVIERVVRPARIPLSFNQERLWFIDQLEGSVQYHMPGILGLQGVLNKDALEYALINIVNRHEVLRTVIYQEDGKGWQRVLGKDQWKLHVIDEDRYRSDMTALKALIATLVQQPFDLSCDHPLRCYLIKLGKREHKLVVVLHHIAADGWSLHIIVNELIAFYESYISKSAPQLKPLTIQYADYTIWQRQYLEEQTLYKKLAYWEAQLSGLITIDLPADYSRGNAVKSNRGALYSLHISEELTNRLRTVSTEGGATLFMTLLTGLKILLSRYSGQEDISIGTPVAGRQQQETEGLVGFFVNMLVLRSRVPGDISFRELLQQIKQITLAAYEHKEVPFEKIVERIVKNRDGSRNPLFQIMLSLENEEVINVTRMGDVVLTQEAFEHVTAKFDIGFWITEQATGLQVKVEYCTDLFKEETIGRMVHQYVQLLHAIVEEPHRKLAGISLLTPAEQRQLLLWSSSDISVAAGDFSFVKMLRRQLHAGGSGDAIVYKDTVISYSTLQVISRQLCYYLHNTSGLAFGAYVVVMVQRTEWLPVIATSLFLSGRVYIPIDVDTPLERLRFILGDVRPALVITEEHLQEAVAEQGWPVITIPVLAAALPACPAPKEIVSVAATDTAYIIYTSGSTGTPKGVIVSHKNLDHFFSNVYDQYIGDKSLIMPFLASHAFDISLFQLFTPLLSGGACVVVDKSDLLDIDKLIQILRDVTVIDTVPGMYRLLVNYISEHHFSSAFKHIEKLFIGGDHIPDDLLTKLSEVFSLATIIVTYGPTEGTIFCTQLFHAPGSITGTTKGSVIGRPIAGSSIYVLDEELTLSPAGAEGEIFIGGAGVSRGYLNRPELTNDRYVNHPYVQGEALYRTGDMGRWTGAGMLEFRGRNDDQVKVRGYRVELGEIENCIKKHEEVAEAVVTAVLGKDQEKTLAAYYIKKQLIQVWPSISEYLGYNDIAYFAMNYDDLRAGSYRDAIYQAVKDKVVVDVGTGPDAILAQHCVAAGAKKVYAIELLEEVYLKAKEKIISLGLQDKITLIHGDVLDVELPEQVDYCVCALVGNMGSSDGCIPIMNSARKLLKDPRNMIPYRSVVKIAAISLPEHGVCFRFTETGAYYVNNIFDLLGNKFDLRVALQHVSSHHLVSTEGIFEELDLTDYLSLDDEGHIELEITADTVMHGFVLWLNLYTAPGILNDIFQSQQSFLPVYFPVFEEGVAVMRGDMVRASVWRNTPAGSIYPDYGLKGELLRPGRDPLSFHYESKRLSSDFCNTLFYQRLFPGGMVQAHLGLSAQELRTFLESRVPSYMMPGYFIQLEQLPLTPNGKVDRRALSAPDKAGPAGYEGPRNEMELGLVNIWMRLLGLQQVGINDNFFERGGHSLLAIQMVSAIRKELGVEVSIKDLFTYTTIALLAGRLQGQGSGVLVPPIKAKERPARIPLSFSQERLWFIDRLAGSVQYHIPALLWVHQLDEDALEYALQRIVDRHEILRTVILEEQGEVFQQALDKGLWRLQILDGPTYMQDKNVLYDQINLLINQPFDLSAEHLIRAHLIRMEPADLLLLTMHHIVADGWSADIMIRELAAFYNAYRAEQQLSLTPLPVQYADYAIWQRQYLIGEVLTEKLRYWEQQLAGVRPLELPTDYSRPATQSIKGKELHFTFDKELTDKLLLLGQDHGSTLFMTLLAAFKILLYRYSGQDDICIGSAVANRMQEEIEGLIGFFGNTLALRSRLAGEMSFLALLQQVRATALEAYTHQDVPFEKVVDAVVKERDKSRSPLFNVMFDLQNNIAAGSMEKDLTALGFSYEANKGTTTKFDLGFIITEIPEGLRINVSYCTDLYKEDTVVRMVRHYKQLLHAIVVNPDQSIGSLNLLTPPEEEQLLRSFNNNRTSFPEDKTVIDLFEEQVMQSPDAIAIISARGQLSYRGLNERANRLAHYLRRSGVREGTLVPLCLLPGEEMMIGILGTMKAGAAYVPVDANYPAARIRYILEDIGAAILISEDRCIRSLPSDMDIRIVNLKEVAEELLNQRPERVERSLQSSDLAYVIYTSGSTGIPKGVMIEHRSVVNYLFNSKTAYLEAAGDQAGSFLHLSYTFDASVTALFLPLISGRKLVIGSGSGMEVFKDALFSVHAPYDFIKLTPAHLPLLELAMEEEGRSFTGRLVVGGEALHYSQLRYLHDKGLDIEIINEYGPTEATVGCTTFSLLSGNIQDNLKGGVPIGKPIGNTQLYVLDVYNNPVPAGVIGEICIGGAGVARGYLGRKELTTEKFIKDSFSGETGGWLYRTGDLGSWLPDGTLLYAGRKDDQVKISGYRVEPGEIEQQMLSGGLVKQAVVLAYEELEGHKRLAAYIVPAAGYDKATLLEYLKGRLPAYMVPSLIIPLEDLPLTSNGKVDKRALLNINTLEQVSGGYSAPRNEVEEQLAVIWQELLGIERVGIHDNFFELGGDSIITIQVVSRARRLGYELQVGDLFDHQTIAKLHAILVQRMPDEKMIPGEQGVLLGNCGLLPIQQWFFEQEQPTVSHFNQSVLLNIDKRIEIQQLEIAIKELMQQHDGLRFVYRRTANGWEQYFGTYNGIVYVIDLPEESWDAVITEEANRYQRSLDIEKGELVRVVLLRTPASTTHHRLLIIIHHLAVDGVTWRIILEDLELLLSNTGQGITPARAQKSSSMRQWYEALMTYGNRRAKAQLSYWKQVVKSYHSLRTENHARHSVTIDETANFEVRLPAVLTKRLLQEVPKAINTEINDLLLCAFAKTMGDWSGHSKVHIGMEGHGREQTLVDNIDLSRTAGWFTSLYPVALDVGNDLSAGDLIMWVREQLRQVPDKGIGYGVLKYLLKEDALQGPSPWDCVFNYLGQTDNIISNSNWFSVISDATGNNLGNGHILDGELFVNALVQNGELVFNWIYSLRRYEGDIIKTLATKYITNLEALIDYSLKPGQPGIAYTPSDYGLSGKISYEELNSFLNADSTEMNDIMEF